MENIEKNIVRAVRGSVGYQVGRVLAMFAAIGLAAVLGWLAYTIVSLNGG